jgi:hypothetical protein
VAFDLSEGLTRKSLCHLILPVLSIDEYESKISDQRAIVVGFFVSDADPARDLCHFIERSGYDIFDTDVSPFPTPEGFYVTWVELKRGEKFPEILSKILRDVENLCEITSWQFTCPQYKEPTAVDESALRSYLILDPNNILEVPNHQEDIAEAVEFWQRTVADQVWVEHDHIGFYKNGERFDFVAKELDESAAIDPLNTSAAHVQNLLGPAYAVYSAGNGYLVECGDEKKYIESIR